MRQIAFYARVSTSEQDTDNQFLQLSDWASRAGEEQNVVGRYSDHAISGRHQGRHGLTELQQAVARREVNVVCVTALDRLGRSLAHLTRLLSDWNAIGCQLISLREAVDTTTPTGRALIQMAGVFAELETEFIRERTKAGIARARAQGKRIGRKPLPRQKRAAIEELLLCNTPEAEIVVRLDVSKGSVYRTRKRLTEEGILI